MTVLRKLLVLFSTIAVFAGSTVLHGSRSAAPLGFVSQGAAPAGDMLTLRVALTSNNVAGLEEKLRSISTPGSPEFRQWLSKDEVKSFVQPSAATVAAFDAWASANGLKPTVISPNEDWLSISLPVSQANDLFAAKFELFTHPALAEPLVRTLSVSLPSELAEHIDVLHPTTDFSEPSSRLAQGASSVLGKRAPPASCDTTLPSGSITPTCLQEIYGMPASPAPGNTTSILVPGYAGGAAQPADVMTFLEQFRPDVPSNTTFALARIDGSSPDDPDLVGSEGALDVEYTIVTNSIRGAGLAPESPVLFLSVGGNGSDFAQDLLDTTTFLDGLESPPSVMSTSYGIAESSVDPSMAIKLCNAYMALGARGISVLFGSGDGGVRGLVDTLDICDNNTFIAFFPSTCPYVTSIGGTHGFAPEMALNLSGGGFSNVFPAPSYQAAQVAGFLDTIPSDFPGTFNRSGRGYPDLAFQAWNYQIVDGGESKLIVGTSAATPSFASMIALINNRLIAAGKPLLGFLNPWIYATAGTTAFTDITLGRNSGLVCPASSVAFNATVGWDALTGFGTPRFPDLLAVAMA
ncbi:Family S53 protease-like protein [Mycena sanguinolenta]|uniref:tripeptidyl-peptidase II n=1 Tax=Mycena sanguinolenta TaxID=230812 RepID=A0A8H7D6C4_9AGAR|nr:Family S53 protease-like protein [Mycena sanguinolenta]